MLKLKKANYPIYILSSLYYLAEVYHGLEKYDDAILTYTKALNYTQKIWDEEESVVLLN